LGKNTHLVGSVYTLGQRLPEIVSLELERGLDDSGRREPGV